jgi:hypothetical protein
VPVTFSEKRADCKLPTANWEQELFNTDNRYSLSILNDHSHSSPVLTALSFEPVTVSFFKMIR